MPTLPLLRRLTKALEGTLNLTIDEGDSHVTFTPMPPESPAGGPSPTNPEGHLRKFVGALLLCPRQDSNLRHPL